MGDESHHDGRCNGSSQRADKGESRQGRVGILRVGVSQHDVVEGSSHGEAEAESRDPQTCQHGKHGRVRAGDEHQEQCADAGDEKAEAEDDLCTEFIYEFPGNRSCDSRKDSQEDDEIAAASCCHAEGVFGKLGHEDDAHEHEAAQDGKDQGDGYVAIGEVAQVDDRVGCPPFYQDEHGQKYCKDQKKDVDLRLADAAGKVKEVQHFQSVHQGKDHAGDDHDAGQIQLAGVFFTVIFEKGQSGDDDEYGDRHVEVEDIGPVLCSEDIHDQTAHRCAEHVGDAVYTAHHAQGHTSFFCREAGAELGCSDRHDAAASHRLNCAGDHQQGEAVKGAGKTAEQGSQSEQGNADDVDVFSAVHVGQLAHDGDAGRIEQGINRDHPDSGGGVYAQVGLYDRSRRSDDPGVQRSHEQPQQIQHQDHDEAAFCGFFFDFS